MQADPSAGRKNMTASDRPSSAIQPAAREETRPAKVGKWTEPALRVLRERYLTRQGGEVVETPEEMCWRVALTIARGEARYGRSEAAVRGIAGGLYDIMIEGKLLPNSATLQDAGQVTGLQ